MEKLFCHKPIKLKVSGEEFEVGKVYEFYNNEREASFETPNGSLFTYEKDDDGLSYETWFTKDLEYVLPEKTVEVPVSEYKQMMEQIAFLDCLKACGVDNWEGYADAGQMMEEEAE